MSRILYGFTYFVEFKQCKNKCCHNLLIMLKHHSIIKTTFAGHCTTSCKKHELNIIIIYMPVCNKQNKIIVDVTISKNHR